MLSRISQYVVKVSTQIMRHNVKEFYLKQVCQFFFTETKIAHFQCNNVSTGTFKFDLKHFAWSSFSKDNVKEGTYIIKIM